MQSNSDGLSPNLRPFLGVGWNRALPAAFGFDKGLNPNGVNGYIDIPSMVGKPFGGEMTLEFWLKKPSSMNWTTNRGYFHIKDDSGRDLFVQTQANKLQLIGSGFASSLNTPIDVPTDQRVHLVLSFRSGMVFWCVNAAIFTKSSGSAGLLFSGKYTQFRFLTRETGVTSYATPVDELRIYNKILTDNEILLNYNSGLGNNPATTENLLVYYKFEEFENLDFSTLQDNSDLRLGIRDLSGNNNHAEPVNMDTNPASGTYVLQPF